MIIGILKEAQEESRVALLPDAVKTLISWNVDILVEKGAGSRAFASDELYENAGAKISERKTLLQSSDIVCGIHAIPLDEIGLLHPTAVLMGQFNALYNKELTQYLLEQKRTAFSMELVPRTTRAQSMDVLIDGYGSGL